MSKKIENAVQPKDWFSVLPRKQYNNLQRINTQDKWFEVYELPKRVLAIYEPGHFQEVISFLVFGNERCLLIDTGMGIGNIKNLVSSLTDKPIAVVNTHSHFDHIGGNWLFEEGYILNSPPAVSRIKHGLKASEVAVHLEGDSTWYPYPEDFDPKNYHIKPFNSWKLIEDGHVFELGGRIIKVLATPGHSPDSIMLLDEQNEILFTGDTFYPATLYAHLTSEDGMNSVFGTYRQTMRALADNLSHCTLYCSHNEPIRPGETLKKVADAFDLINSGGLDFSIDEDGLKKYTFDGFCIVTN